MNQETAPGTLLPYNTLSGRMFDLFRPMIRATDGLSLGQVCAITGLEPATVQNWVKRGFVARPIRKKYHERQLARILLICALRDSMKIERIGELMRLVNGDTDDVGDDILSEDRLYDYLCEVIRRKEASGVPCADCAAIIREVTADLAAPDESARERLHAALTVMVYAYVSSRLKQQADRYLSQMQASVT